MIENILILDTETTGLDPAKGNKVIEIAVVLFNLKHKAVLQCFSTLLPCDENPCENINHISAESTRCTYPYDRELETTIETIWDDPHSPTTIITDEWPDYFMQGILPFMADAAQAIVAHNAEFDRKFVASMPCCSELSERKWICTKKNFTWPVPLNRLRLEDICNAMGVPYVQAHRAMSDCMLMVQCFQKVQDLEERFSML